MINTLISCTEVFYPAELERQQTVPTSHCERSIPRQRLGSRVSQSRPVSYLERPHLPVFSHFDFLALARKMAPSEFDKEWDFLRMKIGNDVYVR